MSGKPSEEGRFWRDGVDAVIRAAAQQQGHAEIERRCRLAGVTRAGGQRHWQASAPRLEAAAVRDEIQQLRLDHHHYRYRRIDIAGSQWG
jgi:putative transposase